MLMLPTLVAAAQNTNPAYRGQGYFTLGFGPGTGGYPSARLVKHVGGGGEVFLFRGVGFGGEADYANWGEYDEQAWIGSVDFSFHARRRAKPGQVDPFAFAGVSLVGPTQKGVGRGSPAGNFGGGVNVWLAQHAALRLEVRDFAGSEFWPFDHVVSFRIGITFR